ncbi:MAG TPA: hypothetical protein VKS81_07155, partial [Bacteroidota bacterium]|nr:hypothetical protein [Bacteroidota bacterium]
TDPYKERIAWWTNGWFIALMAVEAMIGAGSYFMVELKGGNGPALFFLFGWAIFCFLSAFYFKGLLLEMYYYVDGGVVKKTQRHLRDVHKKIVNDVYEKEKFSLRNGRRTAVLDEWKMSPDLLEAHRYFSAIEFAEIEPEARELHLRIHHGELPRHRPEGIRFSREISRLAIEFLSCAVNTPRFRELEEYFDRVIFELESVGEDNRGRPTPYLFLSAELLKEKLEQLRSDQYIVIIDLHKLGDVRFDNGGQIEPHRQRDGIQTMKMR